MLELRKSIWTNKLSLIYLYLYIYTYMYIQLHLYVHIYNIYTVKKDINKIYFELLISLLTVSRYL